MKRFIYIVVLAVMFASCDDSYVDVLPKGKTIPENTDDLALLLNSTNDINSGGMNFSSQADDIMIPDSKIPFTGVSEMNAYTWQDFLFTDAEQDEDWVNFYRIISRANFVLQNIDTYEKGIEYDVDYTKGRALFIRAHAYMYLVNGYGKHYNASTASTDLAVPLLLEMNINEQHPRSTVQQVYDQIITDLTAAIPLLTETSKHRTWANRASAYALLGRVYLYQEKYDLSQENSKKSLDIYSTIKDYNTLSFASGKNAAKGVLGYDSNKMNNVENGYVQEPGWYRTELWLSNELINTFDKTKDLRYWYFTSDSTSTGEYLDGLHIVTTDGQVAFAGIKSTEVLLNYCEALMKQATPNRTEALTYLNKLRVNRFVASSYADFASTDNAVVLDEIMQERRRELRLTAYRWFDMKRLGLTASRTVNGKTFTLKAGSNNYVWAIPLNVMALNDLLEQNPRGL